MKAQGGWLVPTMVVSQPGAIEFYRKIGSPGWYLERVKSVGKDHWAVLQAATIQPARMMGIEDSVGRLEVGQYADIIAVAANPAQEISVLRTISFVMKDGTIYRDDSRDIGRD